MPLLNRREFCAGLASLTALRAADNRPNIVYVLADDLGWGDLGCYNPQSAVPTPNCDRLAQQGLRFTDMHSPSSVCTPTRYGILTGRYCWRSRLKQGVLNGYSPELIEPGRLTVPAMLKSRGYYTAGVGKWHLGLGNAAKTDFDQPLRPGPNAHGFDYYFGIPASLDMEPYVYFENDRVIEKATAHTDGSKEPRGVFWRPGPIAPGFKMEEVLPTITKKACGILDERAKKPSQPFFLYFALTAPHTPWVPTKPFRGRSRAGDYGDFVAEVDDTVGQVMDTLERTGLAKSTLLILTSDNGAHWTPEDKAKWPHRANADWRGMKADIWDAGHRIPFMARWPGNIREGVASAELGCLTDLMGTAAAIVGEKLPSNAGEDSYNMLPALLGQESRKPIREAVVHHSSRGMFSIRLGDWKLCMGLGSGGFSVPHTAVPKPGEAPAQLYNILNDPGETRNLFLERPDVVARLSALLQKYQRDGRSRPE